MRLVPDCDTQDNISAQIEEYKRATGLFGVTVAIRNREKLNPGNNFYFLQYNVFFLSIIFDLFKFFLKKTKTKLKPVQTN